VRPERKEVEVPIQRSSVGSDYAPHSRRKERIMLANDRISAVLASTDLETSQAFYEQRVGLRLSPETIKNHLLFEAGNGTTLLIYYRPVPNKAEHTQVRFWSEDITADVKELADRGVVFEEYDMPTFKTVDHVATTPIGKSAWFKDPDGNTIAIFQPA
jgi:catechol 2,3-dioxygenase-like lactoylglutathione lyase family enzyme